MMASSQAILAVAHDFFELWRIIVKLSFCKQMHDVTVTSHVLIIFLLFFVKLLFFLANGTMTQVYAIVYLRT